MSATKITTKRIPLASPDADRIVRMIEASGRRFSAREVADSLGFPRTSTARLLSRLAVEGRVVEATPPSRSGSIYTGRDGVRRAATYGPRSVEAA